MLRRLLCALLVLSLLCAYYGASFAEMVDDQPIIYDEPGATYFTLSSGDKDRDDSSDILTLQKELIRLGYMRGKASGTFNGSTVNAVREFQRRNGFEETGIATPEMQAFLFSGADIPKIKSGVADENSLVYRMQKQFELWGFTMEEPDGVLGEETIKDIQRFNKYLRTSYYKRFPEIMPAPNELQTGDEMALPLDTPLEKSFDNEITQEIADFVNGKYEFDCFATSLSINDSGEEVKRVQCRLHALNYLALADGNFGENTERALLYFQHKNGLPQTGIADEATQRMLYSTNAVPSEEYVNAYKFVVDISDQRVYVYQWSGVNYGICVGTMICSTGVDKPETRTPTGTFQAAGPTGTGEWYWFKDSVCYAKWATRIVGGILFHSILYDEKKRLWTDTVDALGRKASHGCIRLKIEHAKWIYDNCTPGTTVVIQD